MRIDNTAKDDWWTGGWPAVPLNATARFYGVCPDLACVIAAGDLLDDLAQACCDRCAVLGPLEVIEELLAAAAEPIQAA